MPEISIVIPVYNAEPYIERCLQSIITASVPEDTYEIIAVDDNSTDGSFDMLQKMSETIPQLHAYHRRKAGPGGARNLGLNYAKGRYIMFVDIDDHIHTASFARLLTLLLPQYEQDIIGYDYLKIDSDGNTMPYSNLLFPYCREMTGADYMNVQTPPGTLWGYLFNRRFLLKSNLRFMEKNVYDNEDFIARAFSMAASVTFLPIQIYYFHYDVAGSVINIPDEDHQKKLITDKLTVIDGLNHFCTEQIDSFSQKGLSRKINFMVADVIRELVRKISDEKFIDASLAFLKEIGRYPLLPSEKKYGWEYSIFRRMTSTSEGICKWKKRKDKPLYKAIFRRFF